MACQVNKIQNLLAAGHFHYLSELGRTLGGTMAGAVVELVDLSTNVRRQAKLVGFDISELDTETLCTVYG